MDAHETIEYKGYTIKIVHDEETVNPRTDYGEPITTMAFFHGRYNLGDEGLPMRSDDFNGWDEMEAHIRKRYRPVIIQPVYMYDHSGLTIRMGTGFVDIDAAGWDWGQIGFVFLTPKNACELLGVKRIRTAKQRQRLLEFVAQEIETYNDYLAGECYGYVIEKDDVEVESCWGFLGRDTSYLVTEAKAQVDYLVADTVTTTEEG